MILLKRNDNCWLLKSKVYISRKKILEINRLAKSSFLNPWIEKKINNPTRLCIYTYVLSVSRLNSISNIKVQISVGTGGVWTIYKNTARVYKWIYILGFSAWSLRVANWSRINMDPFDVNAIGICTFIAD